MNETTTINHHSKWEDTAFSFQVLNDCNSWQM